MKKNINITSNQVKLVIQGLIILALWIVPFLIPFRYSIVSFYAFVTFSLIPLLLFSVSFIIYLLSNNKENKKLVVLANAFDVLAIISFVIILLYTNAVATKNTNIEKSKILNDSIDSKYFIDISENENTVYENIPENSVGKRSDSVSTLGYLNGVFDFSQHLNMSFYDNQEKNECLASLEIDLFYLDNYSDMFSNAIYKRTIKDIKKNYSRTSENEKGWVEYQPDDGFRYSSYYQRRIDNDKLNRYYLIVEGNSQFLVVDITGMFSDVNFDEKHIEEYYIGILNDISINLMDS